MVGHERVGLERVPGGGTIFALRAIGVVFLARWIYSMSLVGFESILQAMGRSPWACAHILFIFLLIALPGAAPRTDRPYHPLPQWLRRTLRIMAGLGFAVAAVSIAVYAFNAGLRAALDAVAATNGWLAGAPLLYLAVAGLCRPRPLLSTHLSAHRFAIGCYAVAVDADVRTATVWRESRKLGRYAVRELSMRQSTPEGDALAQPLPDLIPALADRPHAVPLPAVHHRLFSRRKPKVELLWDAPAAAGRHHRLVFRTRIKTDSDKLAARALEALLITA